MLLAAPPAPPSGPAATLRIDHIELCRDISGNGRCTQQAYQSYSPGSRLWIRADLSGFDRDQDHKDQIDLQLTLEVQAPNGQIIAQSPVLTGPQTLPPGQNTLYTVITRDLPDTSAAGDYRLRLLLHDRIANRHVVAEQAFSITRKAGIATPRSVDLSDHNLATRISVYGIALINQIAGHPAPQGQLFLIVDSLWQNRLTDRVYGVHLPKLASVTIDDQVDYPYSDLGRQLEQALPAELFIPIGGQVRGLMSFVVPARFHTATLRYRDDRIGKGDIVIPLLDLNVGETMDFPDAGNGEPAVTPVSAGDLVELDEVEPNDGRNRATPLPTATSLLIHGRLPRQGDKDQFRLTVTDDEPRLWRFTVSALPGVDTRLALHRDNGARLVQVDNGPVGSEEIIDRVRLQPGTYFFIVQSGRGGNSEQDYRLSLQATGRLRSDWEYEFNNSAKDATPFPLGHSLRGTLGYKGDRDWYSFHLDQETALLLNLDPAPRQDLQLFLKHGSQHSLAISRLGGPGQVEQLSIRLPAGDYQIEIQGDFMPRRPYRLTVMPLRSDGDDHDLEDNDSQAQANPLHPGITIDGSFNGHDDDWFAIDNHSDQEQVLNALIQGPRRAQLTLVGANGKTLSKAAGQARYVRARVPPGISYVHAKGSTSDYRLRAWFAPIAPVRQPRTAAQLGLDSLLASAVDWQERHRCFGCHVQGMAVMGASLGHANGYQVDTGQVDTLLRFMQAKYRPSAQYRGTSRLSDLSINGMAQAYHRQLLAPQDHGDRQWLAAAARQLADQQRSDGRWSQSRVEAPVQQGDFQATADMIQLLQQAPGDWLAYIQRGAAYLAKADIGSHATTQDHAYRLIGLVRADDPQYDAAIYDEQQSLLAMQRDDGGWSERPTLKSSPYATGQVLYALKLSGLSIADPRFNAGVRWLVGHQDWSGDWLPLNSSEHNQRRASSFPATMWATIGLAGTLETLRVTIASPARKPLEGPIQILAEAGGDGPTPVTRVEFRIDRKLVCIDEDAPYECRWDAPAPAVPHRIEAIAYDSAGRTGRALLATPAVQGDGRLQVLLAADAPRPTPPNIEILLDASGSMMARFEGRKTRITVAREVLRTLFDELPDGTRVALRVYGNRHYYKKRVCNDTQLLVPLSALDRTRLNQAIDALKPQGMTLIGHSLGLVAKDLARAHGQSVIILVSDGKETCGADACEAADQLIHSGLDARIHVIGYTIDDPDIAEQLACIAEVTGGRYLPAGSAAELVAALRAMVTVEYAVIDAKGVQIARGVVGGPPIDLPAGQYHLRLLTAGEQTVDSVRVRSKQQTSLELRADGTLRSRPDIKD